MPGNAAALISEIRVFYNTLVLVGETMHEGSGVTLGGRAVLEFLKNAGPHTVPRIAESRRVSRQRIQSIVNDLKIEALIETVPNPASRRSPLIRISTGGKKLLRQMTEKESRLLNRVSASEKDFDRLTAQLQEIRLEIESLSSLAAP